MAPSAAGLPDASALDDWVREPSGLLPQAQLNLEYPWPYLQRQLELGHQRARRIQSLGHMMRRPDWRTYHKVMKKATASRGHQCPMCQVPVTMKHLIWQCQYHEQSLPAEWVQMIQANENTMLWARGLIDAPGYRLCEVEGIFSHGWPVRIGPHQIRGCGSMLLQPLRCNGKMGAGRSLGSAQR